MAWDAVVTVATKSSNSLYVTGDAVGTEDDSSVKNISATITYDGGAPDHLSVGSTFKIHADC